MKVIIIGGVAAGMSAAAKFKRLSPKDDVVVYEKGDIVSLVLVDCHIMLEGSLKIQENDSKNSWTV